MLKKTVLTFAAAAAVFSFSSCSKDSTPDPTDPLKGTKNFKFTISAPGISPDADNDYLTFVVVGNSYTEKTIWKVNGELRSNEKSISITADDLKGGGTFVVESVTPLNIAAVGIESINFDAPFTLNYTAEVNGNVETDTHISVADNYSRDYDY